MHRRLRSLQASSAILEVLRSSQVLAPRVPGTLNLGPWVAATQGWQERLTGVSDWTSGPLD